MACIALTVQNQGGNANWANQIVDGKKEFEHRSYAMPEKNVGMKLYIIATGTSSSMPRMIIGEAVIEGVYKTEYFENFRMCDSAGIQIPFEDIVYENVYVKATEEKPYNYYTMTEGQAQDIGNPVAFDHIEEYYAIKLKDATRYKTPIPMTKLKKLDGNKLTKTPQKYTFVEELKMMPVWKCIECNITHDFDDVCSMCEGKTEKETMLREDFEALNEV